MNNSQLVASIAEYIEDHLQEKVTLEELAKQLHYSKFYLLHEFKEATRQSLYNYVKRRRLNEAAKLLLYSDQRIIEVAFHSGYQSQQAFTKAFEELFKLSPKQYRLQNKKFFIEEPYNVSKALVWAKDNDIKIRSGQRGDQEKILSFAQLMRGGLPYLEETEYQRSIQRLIEKENCYLAWSKDQIIGLLLFDDTAQEVENLAVFPSCWDLNTEQKLINRLLKDKQLGMLYTTTFRAADKLDIGHRQRLIKVGFIPIEEIIEINYPTEKLLFHERQ